MLDGAGDGTCVESPLSNRIGGIFSEFFFKWSENFRSDSLGHLTPEYGYFFDLVDLKKKKLGRNFFFLN